MHTVSWAKGMLRSEMLVKAHSISMSLLDLSYPILGSARRHVTEWLQKGILMGKNMACYHRAALVLSLLLFWTLYNRHTTHITILSSLLFVHHFSHGATSCLAPRSGDGAWQCIISPGNDLSYDPASWKPLTLIRATVRVTGFKQEVYRSQTYYSRNTAATISLYFTTLGISACFISLEAYVPVTLIHSSVLF